MVSDSHFYFWFLVAVDVAGIIIVLLLFMHTAFKLDTVFVSNRNQSDGMNLKRSESVFIYLLYVWRTHPFPCITLINITTTFIYDLNIHIEMRLPLRLLYTFCQFLLLRSHHIISMEMPLVCFLRNSML